MNPAILYKNSDLEGELKRADARLVVLVFYAAAWSVQNLGKPIMVTRVESHRSEVQSFYGAGAKPSVHEMHPCRGCDIRSHGFYNDAEVGQLVRAVNFAFEYRPGSQLVAALHETVDVMRRMGRLNPSTEMEHVHLQVPPVSDGGLPRIRLSGS